MEKRRLPVSVPSMETKMNVTLSLFRLLVALSVLGLSTAALGAQDRNLDIQNAPVKPGTPRGGDVFNTAETSAVKNLEKCPPKKGNSDGGDWSGSKCTYDLPEGGKCTDFGADCTKIPNFDQCSCPEEKLTDGGGLGNPGQVQTPDNR